MAGIVDGLGFEEIGQAGSQVAAVWITGSIVSQNDISGVNVYATTAIQTATFSGTNIYAQTLIQGDTLLGDVVTSGLVISGGAARLGIVTATSFADATGSVRGANLGSPTLYRAFVQAGSFATSAGSAATVLFGKQFSTADYAIAISPLNFYAGAGSVAPYASGTRNVSGCEAVGAASTSYDYVAVGI